MPKPFCLLDNSKTDFGLRFLPEGGDMTRFLANPILLYMHQRGKVLGRWNDVALVDGRWIGTPEFDIEDPEAAQLAGKVERGFLRACSMGVYVKEVQEIDGEYWATQWEGQEGSIVDVGSIANSIMLMSASGETVQDAVQHFQNLIKPTIMTEQKKGETAPASAAVPTEIALAAGLADGATPASVVEKIKALEEENKNLKLAAESNKTTAIKTLLDQAIADKKISATERGYYETLAAADFNAVQAIVSKMPVPVDLAAYSRQGNDTPSEQVSQAEEWDKLDRSGKLVELKAKDNTKYKELFKAKFGKEPQS